MKILLPDRINREVALVEYRRVLTYLTLLRYYYESTYIMCLLMRTISCTLVLQCTFSLLFH